MRGLMCATPPMGWNSWNTFTDKINEELIKTTTDAMKEQGFLEAGYEYIVIDDCWSLRERDADGNLVADPEKFPGGMKALADYVHSKGFKFGMYSCCGARTCANYPGSFEHEFQDAAKLAEWGVDYLKYDNCYKPNTVEGETLYRRMGLALANCGRDIVFSACQWGRNNVHSWIRSSGAHLFRSTEDIVDSWNSIRDIALSQVGLQSISGPYCHNDMDMLVVGIYGKAGNDFISAGGCTDEEYQTHFALWAMMNSALMIGCDVRSVSESAKKILLNPDVIAINQDPECRAAYKVSIEAGNPEMLILAKPLTNGDIAVGCFNFGDVPNEAIVNFWDVGLSIAARKGFQVYDCIKREKKGVYREILTTVLPAHGSKIYRCRVVDVT